MRANKSTGNAHVATPFLCARYRDFDLWFEGTGWDLPRIDAMVAGQENGRYADICGDDIAAMADVGWHFLADPVCFSATHGNSVVIASAWAAPIRTENDETGCNLSYAVDAAYEGRSLARLLSCLAFLASEQIHRGMAFANIESRADNAASLALARSLGFIHYPEEDFTMPVAGQAEEVAFHCLRADMTRLRHYAYLTLKQNGLDALQSLIEQARKR